MNEITPKHNGFLAVLKQERWRILVAFALGFTFWLFSGSFQPNINKRIVTIDNVPVNLISSESDIYIVPNQTSKVSLEITVDYKYRDQSIKADDFVITIDVARCGIDFNANNDSSQPICPSTVVILSKDNLTKQPYGVTVRKFEPGSIRVFADRIIDSTQHLSEVNLGSTYKNSLFHITQEIKDDTITLSGPKHQVTKIQVSSRSVYDDRLKREGTFSKVVDLLPSPAELPHGVTISPRQVTVDFNVVNNKEIERVHKDEIPICILLPRNPDLVPSQASFAKIPKTVSVYLEGLKENIRKIDSKKLKAYVDLTDIDKEGEYKIPITLLNLPAGVEETYSAGKNFVILKLEPRTNIAPVNLPHEESSEQNK